MPHATPVIAVTRRGTPVYPIAGAGGEQDTERFSDLQSQVSPEIYAHIQELRNENATRRKALEPYEQLGSPEELQRARALWEASSTPEGLEQIVNEGIEHLGWSFAEEPDPQEEVDTDPESGDLLLTDEQLQERIRNEVEAGVQEYRDERTQTDMEFAIRQSLDGLGLEDYQDRMDVISYAQQFVTDYTSPSNVHEAIAAGHDKWSTRLDQLGELYVDKYLKGKVADATGAEALTGGAAVFGHDEPPVKSLEDAHVRMDRRLEALGMD